MRHFKLQLPKPEGGFVLIEILVASVIFAFILIAFGLTIVNGKLLINNEGVRRQGLVLAQNRLEELKLLQFDDLEALVGEENDVEENPVTGYADFQRLTAVRYVDDDDYTVIVEGPTDSLSITVTMTPIPGSQVNFSDVVLTAVLAD